MSAFMQFMISLLLVFALFRKFKCQNCDFNGKCNWTLKSGFEITDYQTLLSSNISETERIIGLVNVTEKFALYTSSSTSRGIIRSAWLAASDNPQLVCISSQVYLSAQEDEVSIKITIVSDNGRQENKQLNTSIIPLERLHTVTTMLSVYGPLRKYRVIIEAILSNNNNFVVISNITMNKDCKTEKAEDCGTADSFSCGNNNCVKWDQVCNFQDDCNDAADENVLLCDELPSLGYCDFESNMCGWSNIDHDSVLDWTWHSGPSETHGTGPSVDHTTGSTTGHYLYIESSEAGFMDNAVLDSPVLSNVESSDSTCMALHIYCSCNIAQIQHNGMVCYVYGELFKLRFFYHMVGRDIGKLEVKVLDLCSNNGGQAVLLWEKEGSQGDKWHYAEVPIKHTTKRYILKFIGWAALLVHGDIAIDDISLSYDCFGLNHNSTDFTENPGLNNYITFDEFIKDPKGYCEIPPDINKPSTVSDKLSKVIDIRKTSPTNVSNQTSSSMTERALVQTVHQDPEKIPIEYIVIITIVAVVIAIVMGSALLCVALRKRKERTLQSAHLEMISNLSDDNCNTAPVHPSSIDMQLRCAVTELNPNYDFITAKYPDQQLREIPRNKLSLIKLIGQGAFGEVYEGRLKNLCANVSEMSVAVKTLPALSTEQAENDFLMEAVIISKFMHKNVVKCLGVCFDEHPRYIILELLQGGDLKTFLRDSRPKQEQPCQLTMEHLVKLSFDIANGCRHLEEKHFVHRDVAARNCLLTSKDSNHIAKIADFGMSRDIYSADYYRKDGKTMLPIKWMPPEAFLDGVFTTKTDVWSFGVLLWEIFTLGYMPYPGQTNSDVMHFVASGGRLEPPNNCPARLKKIMIMCWNSVADIRPSFNEIIEHLDMCLQDPEVMDVDPADFHFSMGECFKDASTLVKSVDSNPPSVENSIDLPSQTNTASFGRHMESQSREPLLMSSSESTF